MLTPTPYQKVIEKLKNIEDDVGQMNVDRKRTEEGRINSKQSVWEEMARYVVRRQPTSYLYPSTASGPSDQGKLRAQWKHHKIPEISICQRRRFQSSDWLSKTDEQIHVKNAVVKAEAKTVAY